MIFQGFADHYSFDEECCVKVDPLQFLQEGDGEGGGGTANCSAAELKSPISFVDNIDILFGSNAIAHAQWYGCNRHEDIFGYDFSVHQALVWDDDRDCADVESADGGGGFWCVVSSSYDMF